MNKPLVSIICLCYNHGKYVKRAIESVLQQSYANIELIAIDDASQDESRKIISGISRVYGFKTIFNSENLGNCKSFNRGLWESKGKYIIDLAADDSLKPDRIKVGVEALEKKGDSYGVHFCDVELYDEQGVRLGTHYKRDAGLKLLEPVPSGDIYTQLVEKYLISPPAMMMRRSVLEELDGYDEELSYEDFDFWVRSARHYKYAFSDQILVNKMMLKSSLSSIQYRWKNRHSMSTARVCMKISEMNNTAEEDKALLIRINYELKWSLITENWESSKIFIGLKEKLNSRSLRFLAEKAILSVKPPWFWFWKWVT
ncbi:MAG: glycosyltransferase family 2 protein [Cytophagales bacterium]|nr:glycosyltransferase family 2 protein [Cytophagales bacterium]